MGIFIFSSSTSCTITFGTTSSPILRNLLRYQPVVLNNEFLIVISLFHFHIPSLYPKCIVYQQAVQDGVFTLHDTILSMFLTAYNFDCNFFTGTPTNLISFQSHSCSPLSDTTDSCSLRINTL